MSRNHCVIAVSGVCVALLSMLPWASSAALPSNSLTSEAETTFRPVATSAVLDGRTSDPLAVQVGDRLVYRFRLSQETEVDQSQGSSPESCQAVVIGEMTQTLFAMSDRGAEFDVQITDLRAEQADSTLALPVSQRRVKVLQLPNGFVGGYHVDAGAEAELPRMLFLRLHQVPAACDSFVKFEDETGMCDFRFQFDGLVDDGVVVSRTKERLELMRPSEVPVTVVIKESADKLRQVSGRTMRAECHEILEVDAGGICVRATFDLTADCIAQDSVSVDAEAAVDYRGWSRGGVVDAPSVPPTIEESLERLKGLEASDELGSLAMQRLFSGLIERLVADPAAVHDLVKRLLGGEMSPPLVSLDVAGLFVSALADAAAAGSLVAPLAIRQLIDALPNGDLLGAVARSVHQMGALPSESLEPVLSALSSRVRNMGREDMLEGDLELAIGGMLRNVSAGSDAATMGVSALRERMETEGGLCRFVTAIAESRSVSLIRAEVLPLATSPDGAVRIRSREALALCADDARVQDLMVRATELDPEPEVRIAAASAVANSHSPRARAALIRLATEDSEVSVRLAVVRLLCRDSDPHVLRALRDVAIRDADPEVRRAAQSSSR